MSHQDPDSLIPGRVPPQAVEECKDLYEFIQRDGETYWLKQVERPNADRPLCMATYQSVTSNKMIAVCTKNWKVIDGEEPREKTLVERLRERALFHHRWSEHWIPDSAQAKREVADESLLNEAAEALERCRVAIRTLEK